MFDLYNTLTAYEGLLKDSYNNNNYKSKINNVNLMREIKKTIENSPEFYLENIGMGDDTTTNEASKFFEKWANLCYPNKIKFNKSLFLNGFANTYEYLLKSKYYSAQCGLTSKSQLNPDNPTFQDMMSDSYNGIIDKIRYKCQNIIWTNMMKLKSKYPMITKMISKRSDNEMIVPVEDSHMNTYVYLIDYDGSNAESYEKQYSNFDRSELEPTLSEIAKECVNKIFGHDSNIGYDEGGDYKEVCYGIVFKNTFIHVN